MCARITEQMDPRLFTLFTSHITAPPPSPRPQLGHQIVTNTLTEGFLHFCKSSFDTNKNNSILQHLFKIIQ